MNESVAVPVAVAPDGVFAERRSRLFIVASLSSLAIVLIGFAPTLYLRGLFDPPRDALRQFVLGEGGPAVETQLTAALYLHGVALTAWFALLALQAWLVAAGRTSVHRRLGVGGALLAVLVVWSSVAVTLEQPSRLAAFGIENNPIANRNVWFNIGAVFGFAALVGTALLLRKRTDIHKRLMLVASISIIGPALGRISFWPVLADSGPTVANLVPLLLFLALLGLVIVYDVKTRRLPHFATVLGILFAVAARPVAFAIGNSAFGEAFTAALYAP